MKRLLIALFALFFVFMAKAQQVNNAVKVHLKNGYTINGIVIDIKPNNYIKVKLKNDNIVEFKYAEIVSVEVDKVESQKNDNAIQQEKNKKAHEELKQKEKLELEQSLKKKDDEYQANKVKYKEDLANRKKQLEEEKKRKNDLRANELKEITANDLLFFSGNYGKSFFGASALNNLLDSYKYMSVTRPAANGTYSNYGLSFEYQKNINSRKNFLFSFNYNMGNSVVVNDGIDLNFKNNVFSFTIGNCFYQNRKINASIGTGYSFIMSNVITNLDGRNNVLCDKLNYSNVPVFLNFKILHKNTFAFVRPAIQINLLSQATTNFSISAGLGYLIKK